MCNVVKNWYFFFSFNTQKKMLTLKCPFNKFHLTFKRTVIVRLPKFVPMAAPSEREVGKTERGWAIPGT